MFGYLTKHNYMRKARCASPKHNVSNSCGFLYKLNCLKLTLETMYSRNRFDI